MSQQIPERRKYSRYDTEVKIYFQVKYDIETLVKFQVVDQAKSRSEKYSAMSHNVSAEGLSFSSQKELQKGNLLYLEIYLPDRKEPVVMEGKVVWSHPMSGQQSVPDAFFTGVRLSMVSGKSVEESIYYDEPHKIIWSTVLESTLGNFRTFAQKVRQLKDPQ